LHKGLPVRSAHTVSSRARRNDRSDGRRKVYALRLVNAFGLEHRPALSADAAGCVGRMPFETPTLGPTVGAATMGHLAH